MDMAIFARLSIILFALSCVTDVQAEGDKDGLISAKELVALDKLRAIMGNELYMDYMKTDEYLVRWIRDQHFDLNAAAEKIRRSYRWRKANRIDRILEEDFTDIQKLCPYAIDGHDQDQRPIITITIGKCDSRRLALTGNLPRLHRMIWYIFEKGAKTVRDIRKNQGLHVHRVVIIVDLNGFNLRQHACIGCISLLTTLLETNENHFPASLKHAYFINIPRAAQAIVDFILPLVSSVSRERVRLFGHNKQEWSAEILKSIDPDQLTPQFGGTKGTKPVTPEIRVSKGSKVTPAVTVTKGPKVTPAVTVTKGTKVTPAVTVTKGLKVTPAVAGTKGPKVTPALTVTKGPKVTPAVIPTEGSKVTPALSVTKEPTVTPTSSLTLESSTTIITIPAQ